MLATMHRPTDPPTHPATHSRPLTNSLTSLAHHSAQPVFKSKEAASNFDADFTSEPAVLTPTAKDRIQGIDQEEFAGFSFMAPS